ncbi:tubulin delta chain-like [Ornithodoros turicata]|uniref:tubulin delta chain-like n=1 Tax=Ornithodoros turicata TaxID=34597 RepID=UPI0031399F85
MSIVTLQIGQCGNQLGFDFFRTIAQDIDIGSKDGHLKKKYCEMSLERFFGRTAEEDLVARAVLVDTESKVVSKVLDDACQSNAWHYDHGASYTRKQGAGNNWASGYFGHAQQGLEEILNTVRKQVEACDWLSGFLPVLSLSGGTGSGLGTKITEALKDNYPQTPLINVVVWPFTSGEVAVQTYNTLLSLSHLQCASDALLVISNDDLYHIVNKRWSLRNASLAQLNAVGAHQMAALFQPSRSENGTVAQFGDVSGHLTCHPQLKLVTMRHVPQEPREAVPFSSHKWPGLVSSLRRMLLYQSISDEGMNTVAPHCANVSSLLVARGDHLATLDVQPLFSVPRSSFVPVEQSLSTWTSSHRFLGLCKSALLANNGQGCLHFLEAAVDHAWRRFTERAYLHHYATHGLEEEHFAESFVQLEQTVEAYKQLRSL